MRKRVICSILFLSTFLLIFSGCNNNPESAKPDIIEGETPGELAAEWEWGHSISYIDMSEDFRSIKGMAASGAKVFLAGHSTEENAPILCLYDTDTGKSDFLEFEISSDDAEFIYGASSGNDGEVYILAGERPREYLDGDEIKRNDNFAGRYSLFRYGADGSFVEKTSIYSLGITDPLGILVDKSNNIICWNNTEIAVSGAGEAAFKNLSRPERRVMDICEIDGEIMALVYERGATGFCGIDIGAGTWGEIVIDASYEIKIISLANIHCVGAGNSIISNGDGVFRYNEESDAFDSIFTMLDLGVDGTVLSLIELSSGLYACSFRREGRFAIIQKEYREKTQQVLRLATSVMFSDLRNMIARFNAENQDYKIEVEYIEGEYDSLRLSTEILAGNAPDILNLTFMETAYDELTDYFVDLKPMLEDSGYELIPSVLSALERDGKLYSLPNGFAIYSFSAQESIVGERTTWTAQEMDEIFAASSKKHKFGAFATKIELLKWARSFALSNFIDEENYTCRFDSPEFIDQLKMCNEMPEDYSHLTDYQSYEAESLLNVAPIQNFLTLSGTSSRYNGDYSFVGFPNDQGCGSMFAFDNLRFVISEQCENKEAAWAFISLALTDEIQNNLVGGLPVVQRVFDSQLEDALNDEELAITQRDAEKLLNLIESTTINSKNNDDIWYILEEETAPYFAGQKTAEEAAAIIQSRVSTYLAEKK